jgi:hypothetical protein
MTDWLGKTVDRIEDALRDMATTITEILQDLSARNEGFRSHERTLGVLIRHVEQHAQRITALEQKQSRADGRQHQADMDTASTPWWRDWWAVTIMLLTVVPVTLAVMLALGLMTPDQASQAAKAAVEGLFKSLGLSD